MPRNGRQTTPVIKQCPYCGAEVRIGIAHRKLQGKLYIVGWYEDCNHELTFQEIKQLLETEP